MKIRIKEYFRVDGVIEEKPEFTTKVVADSLRWMWRCGEMTHDGREHGIYIPIDGRIVIEAI